MPQASRALRNVSRHHESRPGPESIPFLQDASSQSSLDLDAEHLEDGVLGGDNLKNVRVCTEPCSEGCAFCVDKDTFGPSRSRWTRRWRIASLYTLLFGRRRQTAGGEKALRRRHRFSALRKFIRTIGHLLMLLGLLHCIALGCGLFLAFFPEHVSWPERLSHIAHFSDLDIGHWPTDVLADIAPVACHSHNDYWRKRPLFSALEVGCTGVEPDVWLYDEDLFVGHTTASLTRSRTLRTLYIDPLLEILNRTNPITEFHSSLKVPRNGVFDTNPKQSLVLLIDFKTDGIKTWPYVYKQLEPLREKNYLTYWNGTDVVGGPITVVVTGTAPFSKVVENESYRDMFYDAPLDLMEQVDPKTSPTHRVPDRQVETFADIGKQGGQGHSESAPADPMVYSPANSYYASVSFKRTILHFPMLKPWQSKLSKEQMEHIKKAIAGAHARGLKARYWSVPEWPRGMRNYFWRVLVKEGIDYLNVDDLTAATAETWVGTGGWAAKEKGWWWTWSQ